MWCILVFTFLFLVIDFVQKADRFVDHGASVGLIIRYFSFKTPYVIIQLLPVATLIASILLASSIIKNNELLVIKVCGINPFVFLGAMLCAAFWLTLLFFLVSEFIVPYTSSRSNDIWRYELEQRERGKFYGSHQIWYHGKNAIYWIKYFDYENKTILDPSFYFFDNNFLIIKKIDAREGEWMDDHWKLKDVTVQEIKEDGSYGLSKHSEYGLFIPESPESFIKEVKDLEEMSVLETRKYANQMQQEGYDNTRYLVNMNIKIAFNMIIIIMIIIGYCIPMAQKKARIPLSVSAGIGICLLYILVFSLSRSLGLSGRIPPFLAAWLSNGVFLLFGVYLLTMVRR